MSADGQFGTRFEAILFDFDGVLIDSEYVGNRHIAEFLTSIGHPTSIADSMANFMGLSGADFIGAIERWIDRPLPAAFHDIRREEDARVMRDGVPSVDGAIEFVLRLPPALPKAIASSSATLWITAHLAHIGLQAAFGAMIFSGKEHVVRGKPAPDLYLHAARQLGVAIERTVVIEDSPVGVTGAVASGAHVIGLCAGLHCGPDHAARLRALGVHDVAHDFAEVARLIA